MYSELLSLDIHHRFCMLTSSSLKLLSQTFQEDSFIGPNKNL